MSVPTQIDKDIIDAGTAAKSAFGLSSGLLGKMIFDWWRKRDPLKRLTAKIDELAEGQAKQNTDIAVLKASMVTKEDLRDLNLRIDHLFEAKAK